MWAKAPEAERSRERCENAQKSRAGSMRTLQNAHPNCLAPFVHYGQTAGGLHVSHSLFQCKLATGRVAQLCFMPVTGYSQPVLQPWTKPTDKPRCVKIATNKAGRRAPQRNTTGSPFASIYFVFRCLLSQSVPQNKYINWLSILTPNLSEYAFKCHLSRGLTH